MNDHTERRHTSLAGTAAPARRPVSLTPAQRVLLLRSPLLNGVPYAAVQDWLHCAPVRALKCGEPLIRSGTAHDTLFLLLSGQLSVWLDSVPGSASVASVTPPASALVRKEVARIAPGESVGEQSLIDGQAPNAWAIAEQDSQVLAVPATMVRQSMQAAPQIALNLLRLLSTRMRNANAGLSEAMDHQQRLAHDAETDALTGLHNRRWMERTYPRTLCRSLSPPRSVSILMIDIDHFKRVNDAHGHPVGDQVLCQTARRIEVALRPGDLCARYGGEEFCVLLPEVDAVRAARIAQRICAAVTQEPFTLGAGETLPISVSIGVANWDHLAPLDALLRAADGALYQAKRQGRNQVVVAPRRIRS